MKTAVFIISGVLVFYGLLAIALPVLADTATSASYILNDSFSVSGSAGGSSSSFLLNDRSGETASSNGFFSTTLQGVSRVIRRPFSSQSVATPPVAIETTPPVVTMPPQKTITPPVVTPPPSVEQKPPVLTPTEPTSLQSPPSSLDQPAQPPEEERTPLEKSIAATKDLGAPVIAPFAPLIARRPSVEPDREITQITPPVAAETTAPAPSSTSSAIIIPAKDAVTTATAAVAVTAIRSVQGAAQAVGNTTVAVTKSIVAAVRIGARTTTSAAIRTGAVLQQGVRKAVDAVSTVAENVIGKPLGWWKRFIKRMKGTLQTFQVYAKSAWFPLVTLADDLGGAIPVNVVNGIQNDAAVQPYHWQEQQEQWQSLKDDIERVAQEMQWWASDAAVELEVMFGL